MEEFTTCFEQSITLFLEIGLYAEAATFYEGLGRLDKVAGSLTNTLWIRMGFIFFYRNLEKLWPVRKGCVFV